MSWNLDDDRYAWTEGWQIMDDGKLKRRWSFISPGLIEYIKSRADEGSEFHQRALVEAARRRVTS